MLVCSLLLTISQFAGADNQALIDIDTTTIQDQPDTPAHIFAARAIKHRLWGTPKTDSNSQESQVVDVKLPAGHEANKVNDDISVSPSKRGILLTPGTGNVKKFKTVSFHARNGETSPQTRKRPGISRSKSTSSLPGHFPSPLKAEKLVKDKSTETTARRHDLAELEKRKTIRTDEGVNWEEMYHNYAIKTEREMEKLISKCQTAKHYAHQKDIESTALADDLQKVQRINKDLEKRALRLERQVKVLETLLHAERERERSSETVPAVQSTRKHMPTLPILVHNDYPETPKRQVRGSDTIIYNEQVKIIPPQDNALQPRVNESTNITDSHTPKHTPPASARALHESFRYSRPIKSSNKTETRDDDEDDDMDLPLPSPESTDYLPRDDSVNKFQTIPPPIYNIVLVGDDKENREDMSKSPKKYHAVGSIRCIDTDRRARTTERTGMDGDGRVEAAEKTGIDADRRAKAAERIEARRKERAKMVE